MDTRGSSAPTTAGVAAPVTISNVDLAYGERATSRRDCSEIDPT